MQKESTPFRFELSITIQGTAWLLTLLSIVLMMGAFLAQGKGWLVIPALFCLTHRSGPLNAVSVHRHLMVWSVGVLIPMLWSIKPLPLYLSLIALTYVAMITIVWWRILWALGRNICSFLVGRIALLALYLFFISHHALWFLPGIGGYMIFNPFYYLAPYGVEFRPMVHGQWNRCVLQGRVIMFYPLISPQATARAEAEQAIYKQLACIPSVPTNNGQVAAVAIGAESFFPYELDPQGHTMKQWASILPEGVALLFGAIRKGENGPHQSIFHTKKCLITLNYDKEFYIDGFENSQSLPLLKIKGWGDFQPGGAHENIEIGEVTFQPLLCADALHVQTKEADAALVCMNDYWFDEPMQRLLRGMIAWRSLKEGRLIVVSCPAGCLLVSLRLKK